MNFSKMDEIFLRKSQHCTFVIFQYYLEFFLSKLFWLVLEFYFKNKWENKFYCKINFVLKQLKYGEDISN